MSFGGFSSWIKTFESKIDEALDIKTDDTKPKLSTRELPSATPPPEQLESTLDALPPPHLDQNVELSQDTLKVLTEIVSLLEIDANHLLQNIPKHTPLESPPPLRPEQSSEKYIHLFVQHILHTYTTNNEHTAQYAELTQFIQNLTTFKHMFHKMSANTVALIASIAHNHKELTQLTTKHNNLTAKYKHLQSFADQNAEGAQIKAQFDDLKKEFSVRLGKEEQRNAKLAKDNQKLRQAHAEYDLRLATLHTKDTEIQSLTQSNKDLIQKIAEHDKKYSLLKKENTTLDSKVATLEKQLETLRTQLAHAEQDKLQHSKLIDQMRLLSEDSIDPSVSSLPPQIDGDDTNLAQNIIHKLKSAILDAENKTKSTKEHLQAQMETLKQSHAAQIVDLESSFHRKEIQLRNRMQELERAHVQLTEEKNERELNLKREITSLQQQRLSAEKETEVLLAEHLPETTESLHNEIQLLTQKNAEQQQIFDMQHHQLQNKIRLLENQVKLVEVERDSVTHDYNQLKSQLKHMESMLLEERSQRVQCEKQIRELESSVRQLHKKIQEYETQESVLRSELSILKEQYNATLAKAMSQQHVSLEKQSSREEFTPESSPSRSIHTMQPEEEVEDDAFTTGGSFDANGSYVGGNLPGAMLEGDRAPTRIEYVQLYNSFRKQNEYILVMNQKIHRLEQNNAKLSDQLVSWRNAAASEEQRRQEYEQMKKEHDTALLLLGEKQMEVSGLKADLSHVQSVFRSQVCELVDQIEKLKGVKR